MIRTAAAKLFILSVVLLSAVPALAQTTSYRISWAPNPEPDIVKYIIYRSLDANPPAEPYDEVDASPEPEYIDTPVNEGTRYYYWIKAVNADGFESAYSNPVSGFTITNPSDRDLCEITSADKVGDGSYDINWDTQYPTKGFVQYGVDEFDSMSDWDNTLNTSHVSSLTELLLPGTYLMRAVAYDDTKENMTISMIDTLRDSSEEPVSPTAPLLSIFPIPFLPGMGELTMTNLPEDGSVAIYNANGLEVWTADVGAETTMTWDGTNAQGSPVMSGIYYVVTKDSGNEVVSKKPIMIVN